MTENFVMKSNINRMVQPGLGGRLVLMAMLFTLTCIIANPVRAAEDSQSPLTLQEAVAKARSHSYLSQAQNLDYEGSLEEKHQALTGFLPKVQANYRLISYREQPYRISGGMRASVAHQALYHWDATIIQPLFTGFGLTSKYQMAELTTRVRKQEKQQVNLDVGRDAKSAYYNVLLTEKILQVREQTIQAIQAQESDAQKFFDQELIPLNDLLRAKVALANALQEKEAAAAQLQMAQAGFNLLIGEATDSPVLLEDVNAVQPLDTDKDLPQYVSAALVNRPVLITGRLGLQSLEKAVQAAQSRYYPQVSAFASYEQDGNNPAANENDYANRYNSSAGIQAQWDVFEWGKTRSQVAQSRLGLKAAQQRIMALEDKVRLEVESAYRDLEVACRNIATSEQALGQARENWRIIRLQYQEQMSTSTDVLDAQTYLSQADTNYYLSLYGYLISLADLERAVGLETIP
ncbi:MAG: TolC family protein [Desulfatibacillum sp.]|nr:TolC family protein [Desulfatibacillum sp.]